MRKMTVNFIGAGKLGKTIAKLIVLHRAGSIQAVCNTTMESSRKAIKFIGEGTPYTDTSTLPEASITFITVPDDKIRNICEKFSTQAKPSQSHPIIVHCSGSLSSEALQSARSKGYLLASAHPIRSFASPQISVEKYQGTYCAIEGDQQAIPIIEFLFTSIGSHTLQIDSSKKNLYHAALVIASNYLVGLSDAAIKPLIETGIEKEQATNIVLDVMKSTLYNLTSTRSPRDSLTGPIKRGDIETIRSHTNAIDDPALLELYQALGKALLGITEHSDTVKSTIKSILSRNSQQTKKEADTLFKAKL